jgi:hypothetical protein
MKVQILSEALQDLVDGYRFYESQVTELGDYFLDSVFSDIDSLQFYAGIHALHLGHNRLLSRRFPFAVYYRVENDIARVYAVLDCRRDPSWIRDRLT